jgi:hypothetical protein
MKRVGLIVILLLSIFATVIGYLQTYLWEFWTNVFTEINEECTGGTHDFLLGTHQNLILQGSL